MTLADRSTQRFHLFKKVTVGSARMNLSES